MTLLANPWLILAAVLAISGAVTSAYVKGRSDGRAGEIAERATMEEVARVSREAAMQGAAEKIAAIEVRNVTQRQILEREIVRVPDYSRCVHSPAGLSAINAAITGDEPAGSGELPGTDPADR